MIVYLCQVFAYCVSLLCSVVLLCLACRVAMWGGPFPVYLLPVPYLLPVLGLRGLGGFGIRGYLAGLMCVLGGCLMHILCGLPSFPWRGALRGLGLLGGRGGS